MTADEWDICTDATDMVQYLLDSGKASDRKLRLFAAAVVRQVWGMLEHKAAFRAVELAERFADGAATEEELDAAWDHLYSQPEYLPNHAIRAAAYALGSRAAARKSIARIQEAGLPGLESRTEPEQIAADLTWGVVLASGDAVSHAAGDVARDEAGGVSAGMAAIRARDAARAEAEREHKDRLCGPTRCIFGNPFCPLPSLFPSVLAWENGFVVRLAEAAYEYPSLPSGHLEEARLAVLAANLADAGCTDTSLLSHLCAAGPHVRGCVAVDAVLGRA